MKHLWILAGLVSLGIGIVGIIVPLLPTTPLVLLAAFCFAKGSDRLHQWLINHPRFGPMILDWQRSGAINLRAKRLATIAIIAAFGISIAMGLKPMLLVIQALVLTGVMTFIWTRPNS